jgi:hypothetical protein
MYRSMDVQIYTGSWLSDSETKTISKDLPLHCVNPIDNYISLIFELLKNRKGVAHACGDASRTCAGGSS